MTSKDKSEKETKDNIDTEKKEEKTKKKYNKILKKWFGYDKLKDLQFEIIRNIIDGNDVLSLLPTSYGKSICFQMPHLITKKNVIVISPLISLMEDQTRELDEKNISSICLNSSNKQKEKDINSIYHGDAKIIYTTPEFLATHPELIENLFYANKLALVAIDECHCISSWGNSFRSNYKKLDIIKEIAPTIPVLALTATATDRVIQDVVNNLNLNEPKIIKHSVDRTNLYLEINYNHRKQSIDTVINKISFLINENKDGKVLIYCKTISDTDKVAQKIKNLGFNCESYHAEKKSKERTEIQKEYTSGELDIIVSTIAFGMGINIPNIRLMIHYNCSNDVESYMQEIGRAGRDGKLSKCYMFGSEVDFVLNNEFIKSINDQKIRKYKEDDINYLKKYVRTDECRRKCILKYFGEKYDEDCNNCDNCNKANEKYPRNFTKESYLLFSLMKTFTSSFSMMTYIKLLLGSKEKKISDYINTAKNHHGKGKCYSEEWWTTFFGLLLNNGYLVEERIKTQKFTVSVIKMTAQASTWFNIYKYSEQDKRPNIEINVPASFKKIDIQIENKTEEEKAIDELKKKFGVKKEKK